MAMMALLQKSHKEVSLNSIKWISALAIFGTGLLLADGMITPAISVLSALEGLEIYTPVLKPYIVFIALGILIGLFYLQKKGTGTVSSVFGPVMLVWFWVLGGMGIYWILRYPQVLNALDPRYLILFFWEHGLSGFFVLGAVVLCITGAEALYADLGVRPLREPGIG